MALVLGPTLPQKLTQIGTHAMFALANSALMRCGKPVGEGLERPSFAVCLSHCARASTYSRECHVSKAHNIAFTQACSFNDPFRHNIAHVVRMAVVKLFAGGIKSFAHSTSDFIFEV